MKITITLIAFLAAASTAFATLTMDIEVDGVDYAGETLALDTLVMVKVLQDAENPSGNAGIISVALSGTTGTWTDGSLKPYWDWLIEGSQTFIGGNAYYETAVNAGAGTPGIGSNYYFDMGKWNPPIDVDYDFTFAFTFTPDVTQTLEFGGTEFSGPWDGDSSQAFSEIINVVPEPTTLILLGLGGVALRRKRTKRNGIIL